MTLVGRAVSSERGENHNSLSRWLFRNRIFLGLYNFSISSSSIRLQFIVNSHLFQPNFNFSFNVNFQLQFLLNFSFNFKYTCIDQHVSARAGRAIAQLLHVCSLAWRATLTYTKVMYTYIYVDTNHIYIHLLTHIFSMHKTKPSP